MNIEEKISQYKNDGFLVLRNVVSKKSIDELMDFVAYVIKLEANRLGFHETDKKKLLNDIIIKIRKEKPVSSSWIYETINNSNIYKKFIYNLELEEIVAKLINTNDAKNLGTVSPSFRIDIPGDTKNTRDWHQDGHYFLDNPSGFDSLVVWISLGKATKDNGTVTICSGSHKEEKLKSLYQQSGNLISEQYITPQEIVKKYDQISLETEIGDLAIIQMDLIHKSGYNSSKEVRYTAQIRFTNIEKDDYRPPQHIPKYPKYLR